MAQLRSVGLILACALVAVSCTTEPVATTTSVVTTSTTSTSTTSTTVPETTSTTVSVDERIAEVTEIVREVEYGWFDAIYRKDEAALADWVAVLKDYDIGVELMADQVLLCRPTDTRGDNYQRARGTHRPRGLSGCVVFRRLDSVSRRRRRGRNDHGAVAAPFRRSVEVCLSR